MPRPRRGLVNGDLLGSRVPGLDPLGQLDLELAGEQGDLADLLQVGVHGVGGGTTPVIGRRVGGDTATARPRRLAVHDLVGRFALEGTTSKALQWALTVVAGFVGTCLLGSRPGRGGAQAGGKPLDDLLGHHLGDGFGHRFLEHDRRRSAPGLLDVFDALFAHARHHVLDDVVGELDRLEHQDQVVLGEVAAPAPDRQQRLEALDRDTFRGRPDRAGRLVNLTHSCRPFRRARLATGPRLRDSDRHRRVHRGRGARARSRGRSRPPNWATGGPGPRRLRGPGARRYAPGSPPRHRHRWRVPQPPVVGGGLRPGGPYARLPRPPRGGRRPR